MKKPLITFTVAATVLIACGLFFYARRISEAKRTTCQSCMHYIESGKQQVALEAGRTNGLVDVEVLSQHLKGGIPACPSGGKYSIGLLGEEPVCSIHQAMLTP